MKVSQVLRYVVVPTFVCVGVVPAHAQQTVTIGLAGPMTGGMAALGGDYANGARIAVDEINSSGLTVDGQKVTLRLDVEDDAGDPRTATVVAQALVDQHAIVVVGHMNSGATIPASKIYSDAGTTQISASSSPFYTHQGFKTTFRVAATDAQQGPVLAAYVASKLHAKTVAIIDDATTYGQGLADEFEKSVKAQGVQVASRDATSDKAVDFRAILTKMKGENPDVIMFGGAYSQAGPFAKQAQQLGIRAKIVGGDGICTETLAALAGDAVDNVICSEVGLPLDKMPGGKSFEAKYVKRFSHPIEAYAPYAYDSIYIIADAMKRANSTDKARVLGAMPATSYHGVIGDISFDKNGDLTRGTISIFQYVSGKKQFLTESAMASPSI
jgi:branched-chain amino acid transport system substrate-binding protein